MSLTVNTNVASPKPSSQQNSALTPASPHNISRRPSSSSNKGRISIQSNLQGSFSAKSQSQLRARTPVAQESSEADDAKWGSNFWVTLVDPQTQTAFFACPATGQVSWDPPVGNFVLPPSTEGEWWELSDESRGGIPYYYQTKTGETVWERPEGFVIPLAIIQHTALGRRLSLVDRTSKNLPTSARPQDSPNDQSTLQPSVHNRASTPRQPIRRTTSDQYHSNNRLHPLGSQLTPIPGSPYTTEQSAPPSPSSTKSSRTNAEAKAPSPSPTKANESLNGKSRQTEASAHFSESVRTTFNSSSPIAHRPQQPQSLDAALELINVSQLDSGQSSPKHAKVTNYLSDSSQYYEYVSTPDNSPPASIRSDTKRDLPPSPSRPVPDAPLGPTVGGKNISKPIMNHAATLQMSPVKNRATGRPIAVEPKLRASNAAVSVTTLNTGEHPILPQSLVSDIQLFSESEYARQYFSTHKSGFIFKRKIPVEQLMTWQKAPLTSPLLVLVRPLHKDAVKIFKVIQHIMGDRDKEKPVAIRLQPDSLVSMNNSLNASSTSLVNPAASILEEERWVLGEGLLHGEIRDEIYCQLMKQLTGNPSTESIFRGWQFLCVLLLTFPPSKNFETYLQSFIQKHMTQQEGRIDVIAKYCLRRLSDISRKGPRGKPPAIAEIETAADAAFNPSTFGESLGAIIRLQERNYPHQKVPIILPFLADGILALGGPRAEGIFRVPGDSDSISELKLRIDRGYYTLESVDDPHVLASLMKLWLRELCDPLIPSEMYNECIMSAKDPDICVQIVQRLPTINRRVMLFVISFLQLFLDERTQAVTKMTPANLALVMAPNLLRCNSEAMSVVFTNAQYEQIFVYNLLLYLKCEEIDPAYKPSHGLGAVGNPKPSRNRSRRPNT